MCNPLHILATALARFYADLLGMEVTYDGPDARAEELGGERGGKAEGTAAS